MKKLSIAAIIVVLVVMTCVTTVSFVGQDTLASITDRFHSLGLLGKNMSVRQESLRNLDIRIYSYSLVMSKIMANPVFGYGLGGVIASRNSGFTIRIDSSYLTMWFTGGIAQLLLFISLLLIMLRRSISGFLRCGSEFGRYVFLSIFLAFLTQGALALQDNLFVDPGCFMAAIMFALTVSCCNINSLSRPGAL